MKKQALASAGLKAFRTTEGRTAEGRTAEGGSVRRATLALSARGISEESLVKAGPLNPEQSLPLLVQPAARGVDLVAWAGLNRAFVDDHLRRHGGILFRNFHPGSPAEFQRFITAVSGELLHYTYASTPRTRVSDGIYTSTEYPAAQRIPLHNEMSYASSWPMKIGFYCETPAERGGETPIADSREVFRRVPADVRERFARKKVMYVRNYGEGLDLAWQEVFKTSDPAEVERFCVDAGIEFEWKAGDRLRTRQVCQAVGVHPVTGESVWFNQAHLFHPSSLGDGIRESLLSQFDPEDLPRNACYGDGSPIEPEALAEIRNAYEQSTIAFPWRQGDILLLDNMLAAHGRSPYQGQRRVLVGMAEQGGEQL
jgi:alpha-ketoglutarate-dependent taurine dioxygenase